MLSHLERREASQWRQIVLVQVYLTNTVMGKDANQLVAHLSIKQGGPLREHRPMHPSRLSDRCSSQEGKAFTSSATRAQTLYGTRWTLMWQAHEGEEVGLTYREFGVVAGDAGQLGHELGGIEVLEPEQRAHAVVDEIVAPLVGAILCRGEFQNEIVVPRWKTIGVLLQPGHMVREQLNLDPHTALVQIRIRQHPLHSPSADQYTAAHVRIILIHLGCIVEIERSPRVHDRSPLAHLFATIRRTYALQKTHTRRGVRTA